MSRLPDTRKEETHARILDVGARALREHGYAGIGVASVMKDAGLTHGGFYAHFASRDDLLVKSLEHASRESFASVQRSAERRAARGVSRFRALVEAYLADSLIETLGAGCPVAALVADMPRQSPAVRTASAGRVKGLVASVAEALPPAHRDSANVVAATLVGALQLARALGDDGDGRGVLRDARRRLIKQYDA